MKYLTLRESGLPVALFRYENGTVAQFWDRSVATGAWKDDADLLSDMSGLGGSGRHFEEITKAEAKAIVKGWDGEWQE